MPHEYSRKQLVEIKVTRAGVESWLPAKVKALTRSGAEVVRTDVPGRTMHIMHKDLRPVSTKVVRESRDIQRLGTPRKPAFNPALPAELFEELSKTVQEHPSVETDELPLSVLEDTMDEEVVEDTLSRSNVRASTPRVAAPTKISSYLRERREEAKLSQKTMGDLLDYSPSHLCDVELGFRAPTDYLLQQIATLFDLKSEDLISLRDKPDASAPIVELAAIQALVRADAAALAPLVTPIANLVKEMPNPTTPTTTTTPAPAPVVEALDVFFEFCDKVEEVCPRPRSATGRMRWRELVKELYQLAKEES